MARKWFYRIKDVTSGPVSSSTIRSMLVAGTLHSDDEISDADELGDWKAIARIPSLQKLARNSKTRSADQHTDSPTPSGNRSVDPQDSYGARLAREKRFRVRMQGGLLLAATVATGWLLSAWAGMWSDSSGGRILWFAVGFSIASLVTIPRFFVKHLDDLVADAEAFRDNFKTISIIISGGVLALSLVIGLVWTVFQPGVQFAVGRNWNEAALLALADKYQPVIETKDLSDARHEAVPRSRILIVYEDPESGTLELHRYNRQLSTTLQCSDPDDVDLIVYLQTDGSVRSTEFVYEYWFNGNLHKQFYRDNWVCVVSVYDIRNREVIHRSSGHGNEGPSAESALATQSKDGQAYGYKFEHDPWPSTLLDRILPK